MSSAYSSGFKTGTANITTAASQLTAPTEATNGQVIQATLSSISAWTYASEEAGTFLPAGLNPQTSRYEKTFPVAQAFGKVWVKGSGSQALDWEVLLNNKA